jgi:hypothetical protein
VPTGANPRGTAPRAEPRRSGRFVALESRASFTSPWDVPGNVVSGHPAVRSMTRLSSGTSAEVFTSTAVAVMVTL